MLNNFLEVFLGPVSEVLLGDLNLVKLEIVNKVNNSWGIIVLLNNVIGSDHDLVTTLLLVVAFELVDGVLESEGKWAGVREELVTRDMAFKYSHLVVSENYKIINTLIHTQI